MSIPVLKVPKGGFDSANLSVLNGVGLFGILMLAVGSMHTEGFGMKSSVARMKGGRSASRIAVVALVSIALVLGFGGPMSQPQEAQADFADGSGMSAYQGIVDWVDFSDAIRGLEEKKGGTNIPRDRYPLSLESETQVGDGKLVTTCTIGGAYKDNQTDPSNSLEAYRPGWNWDTATDKIPRPDDRGYEGDSFPYYYGFTREIPGRPGFTDQRGLIAGLSGASGKRRFNIECSTRMVRPGVPDVKVPVKGLVFANAETIDNVEAVAIVPAVKPGQDLEWRLLGHESKCVETHRQYLHRGNFFSDIFNMYSGHQYSPVNNNGKKGILYKNDGSRNKRFYYSDVNYNGEPSRKAIPSEGRLPSGESFKDSLRFDDAIMMSSPNQNCFMQRGKAQYTGKHDSEYYGPFTALYADNAYGADVMFDNNGGNAIAIGVVVGIDMGDAPDSYGGASALHQPNVTGGVIPKNAVTDAQLFRDGTYQRAAVSAVDSPRFGDRVDLDTHFYREVGNTADGGVENWANTRGDDDNGVDDEDGINGPILVYAKAGTEYSLSASCEGEGANAAAWLDWNANGTFESAEKVTATCEQGSAVFSWNVTEAMLNNSLAPGMYRSALRMAITSESGEIKVNGMTRDGEVEDHAVTVVVPGVTVHKQIVDAAGNVTDKGSVEGWEFTPSQEFNQEDADAGYIGGSNIAGAQETGTDGTATWKTNFDVEEGQKGEMDGYNFGFFPGHDITFTETVKDGFQLLPTAGQSADQVNAVCTVPEQPKDQAWRPKGKADTYAWPTRDNGLVKLGVENVNNGFKLTGINAQTVASCTVSNQPYGQSSVTPKISTDGIATTGLARFTEDSGLRFAGTYSCTAPATGPFAGTTVDGVWGPIKKDETWTSDVTDKIPLGSTCTVTQTQITSVTEGANGSPMAGFYLFKWAEVQIDPTTVVATNNPVLGETVPVVTVTNPVEMQKLADVNFDKVDGENRLLAGAKFGLVSETLGSNGQPIVDVSFADAQDAAGVEAKGDSNPTAGKFTLKELPIGTYTLTEVEAPVGYLKLDQPISFEVTEGDAAAGSKTLAAIVNKQVSGENLPKIPLTGGIGSWIYSVGGSAIAVLAAIIALVAIRRRKAGTL